MVLITHRPGILAVADNVVILKDGVLQAQGPRDAVLAALRAAQPARGTGPGASDRCSAGCGRSGRVRRRGNALVWMR